MNPMPAAANSSFVTLRAGGENFAIEVCFVREILEYSPITPLPQAPPFLLGVINVRGCTVPVVDLCIKLGLPTVPVSVDTRILVLEITVAGRQLVVGLLVDKVFEVAEFEAGSLEAVPDVGGPWNSEYIRAISYLGGNFVVIFDMERLFGSNDAASLQAV